MDEVDKITCWQFQTTGFGGESWYCFVCYCFTKEVFMHNKLGVCSCFDQFKLETMRKLGYIGPITICKNCIEKTHDTHMGDLIEMKIEGTYSCTLTKKLKPVRNSKRAYQ